MVLRLRFLPGALGSAGACNLQTCRLQVTLLRLLVSYTRGSSRHAAPSKLQPTLGTGTTGTRPAAKLWCLALLRISVICRLAAFDMPAVGSVSQARRELAQAQQEPPVDKLPSTHAKDVVITMHLPESEGHRGCMSH